MLDRIEGVRCFSELLFDPCIYCERDPSDPLPLREFVEEDLCQAFFHQKGSKSLSEWWFGVESRLSVDSAKVGLKITGDAWKIYPDLLSLVKQHFDVIHLARDPVLQAISGLYARKIGHWNVPLINESKIAELDTKKNSPVVLDPAEVALEATYAHAWQSGFQTMLQEMKGVFIEVRSEEIFGEQKDNPSLHCLAEYFSAEEISLGEARYARNITSLSTQIANLVDIQLHLEEQRINTAQLRLLCGQ